MKDIIIRNGENISAKEVEDLLFTHPKVADVAVIGLPDARTGERVCAVVVAEDRAPTRRRSPSSSSFTVANGLAKQKIPEQLEIVDVLPRNPTGKVLKHELRDRFSEALSRTGEQHTWECSTARSASSPAPGTASAGATPWSWPSTAPRSWSTTSAARSPARAPAGTPTSPSSIIEERGGEAVANYARRRRLRAGRRDGASRRSTRTAGSTCSSTTPASSATAPSGTWRRPTSTRSCGCTSGARGCRATSPPSTGASGRRPARRSPAASSTPISGAGLVGNFGQTNYATAKAAIAGLTQTLSLELYKLGVTVNAVGPAAATRITGTMPERPGGHRARRRARGRVEPHGPGGVVAARGVAGVATRASSSPAR